MNQSGLWRFLNQPFTLWAFSVITAVAFIWIWRPYELDLQSGAAAAAEHNRLHVEVKSRLQGMKDEIREKVSTPEMRRSLDTGSTATIYRDMETRSLRSLSLEHDELVASGRIHCPTAFGKGAESIYEALRSGGPDSVSATKTGVELLLSQLGGGSAN